MHNEQQSEPKQNLGNTGYNKSCTTFSYFIEEGKSISDQRQLITMSLLSVRVLHNLLC